MAKYYNKTRGPISCSLTDGTVVSIAAKSWSEEIPEALEGSADLQQKRRKGYLKRRRNRRGKAPKLPVVESPSEPAPAPKKAPKEAPKKKTKPKAKSEPVVAEEPEKPVKKKSKKSTSKKSKKSSTKKTSSDKKSAKSSGGNK